MKKIILSAIFALLLCAPALANSITDSFKPDPASTVFTGASVTAGVAGLIVPSMASTSFAVAAIGGTGLMYIIASGFDPWTPTFSKVERSYPNDHVTGTNVVLASAKPAKIYSYGDTHNTANVVYSYP